MPGCGVLDGSMANHAYAAAAASSAPMSYYIADQPEKSSKESYIRVSPDAGTLQRPIHAL